MPKHFIWVHEKRAKIDSERIYGNPGPVRDKWLSLQSRLLGKIFNMPINRPNKGKIIKTNEHFDVNQIIKAKKGK